MSKLFREMNPRKLQVGATLTNPRNFNVYRVDEVDLNEVEVRATNINDPTDVRMFPFGMISDYAVNQPGIQVEDRVSVPDAESAWKQYESGVVS